MSGRVAFRVARSRRFVPLWAAQTFGAFNDNLFRYSLVTLAAYQGFTVFGLAREEMAPIAATAFTLPIFLFSALSGQVADKFDRTAIMRVTKFLEIWLMAAAAAGFLLQSPMLLLAALFAMGVQTAFFIPARNSAMPTLLEKEELVAGNALVSGAVNVAILAGAIGGTALVGVSWGPNAIAVALMVFALIGWLAIRQGPPAPAKNADMTIRWNIVVVTVRMLAFVIRAPDVLRPLLAVAWFWMLAATVVTILPLFTRDVLGADPFVVALFQLLFTVGAALGAVLCGVLSRGGDAAIFSLIGGIGLLVFPLDLALYTWSMTPAETLVSVDVFVADPQNWRIIADFLAAAVCGGFFLVPVQAMAQRRADDARRGRILAASGILNGAAASLGQFVLFALARLDAPLHSAFLFVAAGSGAAALAIATRLLSRLGRRAA